MEKKKKLRVIIPRYDEPKTNKPPEKTFGDAMEEAKRQYNVDTAQCLICEFSENGFCSRFGDFCDKTRKGCDIDVLTEAFAEGRRTEKVSQESCDWDLALFASKIKIMPNVCWIFVNDSTAKGAKNGSCDVVVLYKEKARHLALKTDAKRYDEMIHMAVLKVITKLEFRGILVNVMVTEDAGYAGHDTQTELQKMIAAMSKKNGLNIVFRVFHSEGKAVNQRMAEVIRNSIGKSYGRL